VDTKPMECGVMGLMANNGNTDRVLCPPLERLKREHDVLREKMNRFHSLAESMDNNSNPASDQRLAELRDQVSVFFDELELHSEKEEKHLFSIMARYIGREVGPIAVMEYEHEQARKTLQLFMDESKNHLSAQDNDTIRTVLSYAIQAYSLLSVHFMKEENVLFPMADQMLSEEEKATLNQNI
jgi:hemerythrin-like domain-containing protein